MTPFAKAAVLLMATLAMRLPLNAQGVDFIALKYKVGKGSPYITNIVRVSKSGQRVYSSYKNLPRVLGGIGVAICLFQVV